jgi:molecular chaperone DnaK (HSP70)
MPARLAIDFGTSNTVVSLWDETHQMDIPFHIPDYGYFYQHNQEKISVIPSQIHYASDQRRWLGYQVEQQNLTKSDRTFRWMKRYISNRSPVQRKIDVSKLNFSC